MWNSYSYLGRLADSHDYKWFGLNGLNAKESLAQYGIAARYMGCEYECYVPDPDEEDCSIYFVTTEGYIEERLQNCAQLAKFMFEKRITLRDFMKLQITEQLHLLCDFFNIIDFLELNIDECYERDMIVLNDTPFTDIDCDNYSITKRYSDVKKMDIYIVRLKKYTSEKIKAKRIEVAHKYGGGYSGFRAYVFNNIDSAKSFVEEVFNEKHMKEVDVKSTQKVNTKKPLLVEDFADKSFEPLHKAIQSVVDDFGNGIVSESEFVNILDDYHAFKGIPGVKRIFRIIAENGYLSDWTDENTDISTAFIAKTANSIALKYGFNEVWVNNSITTILVALGYATTEATYMQDLKDSTKYPSELFKSYDSYNKKCLSYEYNEINRDSYLPDRKGVLYSGDKKALVSKGDFSQSSYSIRQGTMYVAPNSWAIPSGNQSAEIELFIPNSVVAIGYRAFSNTFIRNLEIPSSVKYIGSLAFCSSSFSNISLNEGVEYIGDTAFKYTNLARISLPKTLKYVGGNAFPKGIQIINQSDFLSVRDGIIYNKEETLLMCCTSEDAVIHLPDTVEEINPKAFNFNIDLINIELSKSLRKIGRSAFSNCENMKSIILPESLEEIDDWAFEECEELYSLEIPHKVKKIGKNIIALCSSLSNVRCFSPYFDVIDDALYDIKKKKLIAYFGIDREYEVKKGTKIIGESAFQNITSLKKITLPKSVTLVEFWAFEDCTGLEEVRVLNPSCEFDYCGIDENIIKRVVK